ncbi:MULTISPECIES: hypothetical protein [Pseudomonas]|uniref:OB-fold protein n=1 Tax=Pseudomonas TaxID=286 RepID=UPI00147013A1|nr:hypothetical protein [Pseudomonas sp. CES]KAF4557355.1 hypothetical protein HBJ16_005092 [Pseudomonas sp. CES]
MGILLVLGIFFVPFVFVWFLLRKGHSNLSRFIGFGYLAGVFLLPMWEGSGSKKSVSVQETYSQSGTPAEKVPPVSLPRYTAKQMASAYESNTVAADQIFKGKEFEVSGVVQSINTDFLGHPYVTLRGGVNQFLEPQFAFDKGQESVVAGLRKGQSVTLVCTGKGDIAKTPMSEDCTLSN